MAEINVERKKNVWPWVVALVVVLLLIWGALAMMDNRTEVPFAEQPAATMPAPIREPGAPAVDTATTGDAARDVEPSPTDDPTAPQQ